MPTLTIGDKKVTVDDSFMKLSPDQQNATVEEISKSMQPSDGWGLAKSAGVGLAKGLIGGTVAFPGNVADLLGRGSDWVAEKITGEKPASAGKRAPFTSDYFEKKIEGVTGPFYKPKNTAEDYAQTVGEFLGDPTSYVGGGGLARKVGGALAGAVGSETAGQVAKKVSPDNETLARIVGGVAGGKLSNPRAPKAAAGEAPTREQLLEASGKGYEELKNKDVPLRKDVVENLSNDIRQRLNNDAFYHEDQPRTFRAVDRLTNPVGPNSSAKEVYAARTALNHIIGDMPGSSEAKAAKMALERLDDHLSNVPGFADAAKQARGDYRAAKQSERVTGAQERGELNAATSGSGANVDNALRQRIKGLYLDKKVPKTPEEAALMEEIARGSTPINLARLLSKLGPKHPLTGWGTALAADLSHSGGLATATLAIGAVAQYMAERGTSGKIQKLDEIARRNSPLGQAGARGPAQQAQQVPWGEVRGGLGAVPGALEAGGGSPLAPGRGADLGSLLAPSANAAEAPKNPWQKKPMIEAGRGGGGGSGTAPAPVSGIMSGISYRLPPAQYEELAAARRAGATKAELQSMIDRFSGKTPQAGQWSPEKEQQYRDYRRGGSPGQWQDDFEVRLKQDLGK